MSFESSQFRKWYSIVPSRCAAWLMAHLHYWHDKKTTERDGHLWVIRTYSELRDDHHCPYSERSIKRAVSSLKAGGYIDVILAPHPYRGALRSRWLRFSDDLEAKIDEMEKLYKQQN